MANPTRSTLATSTLLFIEAIWWLITVAVCVLVIFPIYNSTPAYPFYGINILFIVSFIMLVRYIFFLRYSLIAWRQYLKLALIFLAIPLIFNLVNNLNYFITYIDENTYDSFLGHINVEQRGNLVTYIRTQMLLFGVGSIFSAILFPIRMIISIWRVRNRGVV